MLRLVSLYAITLGLISSPIHKASALEVLDRNITIEEVKNTQNGWCDALLQISKTYHDKGFKEAKNLSSKIIDIAYGYDIGPVAFNPTWTYQEKNFRPTKRGALSYFVGGDSKFKQDPGFAIGSPGNERSQWMKCEIKNAVIQLLGGSANTMGNVTFTAKNGFSSTVDKTWTFLKTYDGNIKIILHESATPFK